MGRYAADTKVSADRSRAEIERVLRRYGCEGFMYAWEEGRAIIAFKAHGKAVQFRLPLPDFADFEVTEAGRSRTELQQAKAYEQAVRQRWRALALAIKAKLEAVESGILSFEDEFLAHFVLPDGQTVGERLEGDLTQLGSGSGPALLPPG